METIALSLGRLAEALSSFFLSNEDELVRVFIVITLSFLIYELLVDKSLDIGREVFARFIPRYASLLIFAAVGAGVAYWAHSNAVREIDDLTQQPERIANALLTKTAAFKPVAGEPGKYRQELSSGESLWVSGPVILPKTQRDEVARGFRTCESWDRAIPNVPCPFSNTMTGVERQKSAGRRSEYIFALEDFDDGIVSREHIVSAVRYELGAILNHTSGTGETLRFRLNDGRGEFADAISQARKELRERFDQAGAYLGIFIAALWHVLSGLFIALLLIVVKIFRKARSSALQD